MLHFHAGRLTDDLRRFAIEMTRWLGRQEPKLWNHYPKIDTWRFDRDGGNVPAGIYIRASVVLVLLRVENPRPDKPARAEPKDDSLHIRAHSVFG